MTDSPPKPSNESHVELGKFIIAFEDMVEWVRRSCALLMTPNGRWQQLVNVALHHQVMTAKPLMDVLRAVYGTLLNDEETKKAVKITDDELAVANKVLAQINTEYDELTKTRNHLVHGTWFMDFSEPLPNRADFVISKMTTSKSGPHQIADLPQTAAQLRDLTERCEAVSALLMTFVGCWAFYKPGSFGKDFRYNESRLAWEPVRA